MDTVSTCNDGPSSSQIWIVAVGRIIYSDEFSTFVDPFVSAVFWEKDNSGYKGWHYIRDKLTIARTIDDEVKIDWWAPFPKEAA